MRCKLFLLSLLLLTANAIANDNIDGIWKHAHKPAWLEITFESDVGALSVKRHDNNDNAAGLNVIKDIRAVNQNTTQWHGQMYSALDNNYVEVILILTNSSTISIFRSSDLERTNEILRLLRD